LRQGINQPTKERRSSSAHTAIYPVLTTPRYYSGST
jgi:hypothetical protein